MAKLRPEIEKLCRQHNFKYYVEENEGRILVKFGEGAGQFSHEEATSFWDSQKQQQQNYGPMSGYAESPQAASYQQSQPQQYQNQYQGQQQFQGQSNQGGGGQNNDIVEEVVKKAAPVIFRKLLSCCTIM